MGKFLNSFNNGKDKVKNISGDTIRKAEQFGNKKINENKGFRSGRIHNRKRENLGEDPNSDMFDDDMFDDDSDSDFNSVNVQPSQKPASFHHYILENQYKDLEKSIRGYKDVFTKETQKWEVKRKNIHCFLDEEAEEILRTAQSHLATDIKLTFYNKETFGIRFLAIYETLEFLFRRIMEYRFGRFGDSKIQGEMKEQALKIFIELITRIEANYLRAVGGMENKLTHQSVQSQESLQGRGDDNINERYS